MRLGASATVHLSHALSVEGQAQSGIPPTCGPAAGIAQGKGQHVAATTHTHTHTLVSKIAGEAALPQPPSLSVPPFSYKTQTRPSWHLDVDYSRHPP